MSEGRFAVLRDKLPFLRELEQGEAYEPETADEHEQRRAGQQVRELLKVMLAPDQLVS